MDTLVLRPRFNLEAVDLYDISLKLVPWGQVNIQTLFQIMAWRQIGDKPLSEPMLTQEKRLSTTSHEHLDLQRLNRRFNMREDVLSQDLTGIFHSTYIVFSCMLLSIDIKY